MKADNKARVAVLDVVRVIAVIMVMLHHYYTPNTYPDIGDLFHFGALGVPLFFIISGFVIYSTLERTNNYKEFIIKRFVRLSPAMLICSTITFVFFSYFYEGDGYHHSKSFVNYIIANTFIDPNVFNIPNGWVKYYYIDNAYWSLWVEICFYSLIGFLYFFFKKRFIFYYIIICSIGMSIFLLFYTSIGALVLQKYLNFDEVQIKYYKLVARAFVFFFECLWFLLGIYLYKLYHNKNEKKYIYYIILIFIINIIKEKITIDSVLFAILTFIFLMIFVYRNSWLDFMCKPILCKIGVASYAMYLIHYHLGVVAIQAMNEKWGSSYVYPIVVVFIVIIFGMLCYNYLEKNLIQVYKKIFKI